MGLVLSITRNILTSSLHNRLGPPPRKMILQGSSQPANIKIGKCIILFLLSCIIGYGILIKVKEYFEPTQEQLIRKELAKFEKDMNLAPGSLNGMLEQWIEDGKKEMDE